MIRCPQCSTDNQDGTIFCDFCGFELSGVAPQASSSPASVEAVPAAHVEVPASSAIASPDTPEVAAETSVTEPPSGSLASTPTVSPTNSPASGVQGARLVVLRGLKPNEEFTLWEGDNVIGRTDERPVDIDLESQESPDRMWVHRQHATIRRTGGVCVIVDMGGANGTFVNRGARLQPGQPVELRDGDVIQVGTVHLKFLAS